MEASDSESLRIGVVVVGVIASVVWRWETRWQNLFKEMERCFIIRGNSNEEWEQPTSTTHETDPILKGELNIAINFFFLLKKDFVLVMDNECINRYREQTSGHFESSHVSFLCPQIFVWLCDILFLLYYQTITKAHLTNSFF